MTIGERIKERRMQLDMTLLQLAEQIGVREATVQRYESGFVKNIKHKTIENLAKALKTTEAYLHGYNLSEYPEDEVNKTISKEAKKLAVMIDQLSGDDKQFMLDMLNKLKRLAVKE